MPQAYLNLRSIEYAALKSVRSAILIVDANLEDLPIVFVNGTFEELTGYGESEVIGRNCRFLRGPETDPADVQKIERALEKQEPVSVTILNYRKNGTPFYNDCSISPVYDSRGAVSHFVECMNSVESPETATLRSEAQDKIAKLSKRELQIFHGLARGLSLKKISGNLDISVRTAEKYKYRMQEKMGTNSLPLLVRYAVATGFEFSAIMERERDRRAGVRGPSNGLRNVAASIILVLSGSIVGSIDGSIESKSDRSGYTSDYSIKETRRN